MDTELKFSINQRVRVVAYGGTDNDIDIGDEGTITDILVVTPAMKYPYRVKFHDQYHEYFSADELEAVDDVVVAPPQRDWCGFCASYCEKGVTVPCYDHVTSRWSDDCPMMPKQPAIQCPSDEQMKAQLQLHQQRIQATQSVEDAFQTAPGANVPDDNPKTLLGLQKPSLAPIPPAALFHLGRAMSDGRRKYGLMNWREKTVSATIYYDAAMRHLLSWFDGEEVADDSKVHHLGHAMACLGIILDAQATGNLNDDRPIPGVFAKLVKEHTTSLAKH